MLGIPRQECVLGLCTRECICVTATATAAADLPGRRVRRVSYAYTAGVATPGSYRRLEEQMRITFRYGRLRYLLTALIVIHVLTHLPHIAFGEPTAGADSGGGNKTSNAIGRKRSLSIEHQSGLADILDFNIQNGGPLDYYTTPASGTGCSACRLRSDLQEFNLATIREHLLAKMGFKQAPNMTGRTLPRVPENVMELYKMGQGLTPGEAMLGDDPGSSPSAGEAFKPGPMVISEEDDYHARTDRVIAFAQQQPRIRHNWKGNDIHFFKFTESITKNSVRRAMLYLFVKGNGWYGDASTNSSSPGINIKVCKVVKGASGDAPILNNMANQKVAQPSGKGAWIKVDVTRMVKEWFRTPRENLGMVVRAQDSEGRRAVVLEHELENGSMVPFVEVSTVDGRKRRIKRNIGLNCHDNSDEKRCCRYPLTVDFEEFGWDWIIAPKTYDANYCQGECPYVFLQRYPHTHIVQLANPIGSTGPCCAPRKMSSIPMLYFDNELNIIHGTIPGMVVDRCGCA